MTLIETTAAALRPVTLDLYRDIHKGIRAELFAVTGAAGSLDPTDRMGRVALQSHLDAVVALLSDHAEHEDLAIEPHLHEHLPELAERIAADHARLERRLASVRGIGEALVAAPTTGAPRLAHLLYLELAAFTGTYLEHQDLEERVVMPALEEAVGVDAVAGIHATILAAIPPAEMARSLALMLPAMNVDDRVEMLEGMRASAPNEAFQGVVGLARSVLAPAEVEAVLRRLDAA